ncbi:hypothetical protein COO60DRAFT_267654 [Scenedesmus sp. NREL 46B-D3]|nr:hypothetical protein COO60DRAFT_267654 [Scenedesmus sp. NREL 46B-D3]
MVKHRCRPALCQLLLAQQPCQALAIQQLALHQPGVDLPQHACVCWHSCAGCCHLTDCHQLPHSAGQLLHVQHSNSMCYNCGHTRLANASGSAALTLYNFDREVGTGNSQRAACWCHVVLHPSNPHPRFLQTRTLAADIALPNPEQHIGCAVPATAQLSCSNPFTGASVIAALLMAPAAPPCRACGLSPPACERQQHPTTGTPGKQQQGKQGRKHQADAGPHQQCSRHGICSSLSPPASAAVALAMRRALLQCLATARNGVATFSSDMRYIHLHF